MIITLHIEGTIDLEVEDVWPDGDAPEEVTPEAVAEVVVAEGSLTGLVDRWCLGDLIDTRVNVIDSGGPWDIAVLGEAVEVEFP